MGSYTAIADTGNALVRLLQHYLVPDTILNADSIGLCSPADHGDFMLGIHLYNVEECMEMRDSEMVDMSLNQQKYPPSYLTLYYMITPFSTSDLKFRAEEEQRIMGRVLQVLKDYGSFDADSYQPVQFPKGLDIRVELEKLSMEEKLKIWNVPDAAYRTSLFYRAVPVSLESSKFRKIRRVTDVNLAIEEKEHG